ncbi:MAG: RnfH family protein [Pseudomonadota bacterium]
MQATFDVTVVYAEPNRCTQRVIAISGKTTIAEALAQSGIAEALSVLGVDITTLKVGVWGVLKDLNATLKAGDRIELNRPLQCDPKQRRRAQAKAQRLTK